MYREDVDTIFKYLGLEIPKGSHDITTPIDGSIIGTVDFAYKDSIDLTIRNSQRAFDGWKEVPAPRRGELIRLFAEQLRKYKNSLGTLVSIETGKILQEGEGEVQEMIDICDFAVGLSRQLYGLTMGSERAGHRLMETWHPLGVVGVISAFNFPVAVWSWNLALAIVCGNSVVWKPSEKTPLTAIVCQKLFKNAMRVFGDDAPENLSQVIVGDSIAGSVLVNDPKVKLVSATGSTQMGKRVAIEVASRLGRYLLELGGNNAMIITPYADIDMAIKATVFSAVGTAGQRCTTLRRLFVHEDIYSKVVTKLIKAYETITVGIPLLKGTLVGPIIDQDAFDAMQLALGQAISEGAATHEGHRVLEDEYPNAYYVQPAIVEIPYQAPIVFKETFAPILYVMKYDDLDEVMLRHNEVSQGLSSCIFSNNIREIEMFLATSDCGLANVNIGPSGAEIGGAFGGEKDTGGGREAGTESWKAYMRRATNTINYSDEMPLAQGIKFDI